MAIDTETKRKSILAFGSGDLLPKQDGTIDAQDKLTLLWLYYGIAASTVVLVTRTDTYRPDFMSIPSSPRPAVGVVPNSPRPAFQRPPDTYRPDNQLPIGG